VAVPFPLMSGTAAVASSIRCLPGTDGKGLGLGEGVLLLLLLLLLLEVLQGVHSLAAMAQLVSFKHLLLVRPPQSLQVRL